MDVVALLLHHGATLGSSKQEDDLLDRAVWWQPAPPALDVINWLLDHGVPPDGRNLADGTPLMLAAYQGAPEVVELLIARGADVNARAKDGTRVIDMARSNHRDDIMELLRRHGAKGSHQAILQGSLSRDRPLGHQKSGSRSAD